MSSHKDGLARHNRGLSTLVGSIFQVSWEGVTDIFSR